MTFREEWELTKRIIIGVDMRPYGGRGRLGGLFGKEIGERPQAPRKTSRPSRTIERTMKALHQVRWRSGTKQLRFKRSVPSMTNPNVLGMKKEGDR